MDVRIYGELREQCPDTELQVANIQQTMAGIKQAHGLAVSEHLMFNKYYYFLVSEDKPEELIPLYESALLMDFSQFDVLLIVPDVQGDAYGIIALGIVLFTVESAIVANLIVLAANIAIALAVGFLMQMLSPTPTFDSDPSQEAARKDSSLFNGPPNIREQGGSVPWCMGESNAGGVLISAGLYSEYT